MLLCIGSQFPVDFSEHQRWQIWLIFDIFGVNQKCGPQSLSINFPKRRRRWLRRLWLVGGSSLAVAPVCMEALKSFLTSSPPPPPPAIDRFDRPDSHRRVEVIQFWRRFEWTLEHSVVSLLVGFRGRSDGSDRVENGGVGRLLGNMLGVVVVKINWINLMVTIFWMLVCWKFYQKMLWSNLVIYKKPKK